MRKESILLIVILLLIFIIGGGTVWLARAPIMPPQQTVVQSIPDDRISH
jgi:hypothetical protein